MICQHNRLVPFRQLRPRNIPLTTLVSLSRGRSQEEKLGSRGRSLLYLDYSGGFRTSHFWCEAAFGERGATEAFGKFGERLEALECAETDSALEELDIGNSNVRNRRKGRVITMSRVPATVTPPTKISRGVL